MNRPSRDISEPRAPSPGAFFVHRLPCRDPERFRGYLWVMGPYLKGAGSVLFILDHVLRGSPLSFLRFAAGDGILAVATLWALLRPRGS